MSDHLRRISFLLFASIVGSLLAADSWQSLLDAELSDWEVWTGVPHETVPIDWAEKGDDGKTGEPLGLGWNERGLYRVSEASGEPVLRVRSTRASRRGNPGATIICGWSFVGERKNGSRDSSACGTPEFSTTRRVNMVRFGRSG